MSQESIQTSHKNLPIRSNLSFCVFYTHKKTHKKSQHHYDPPFISQEKPITVALNLVNLLGHM